MKKASLGFMRPPLSHGVKAHGGLQGDEGQLIGRQRVQPPATLIITVMRNDDDRDASLTMVMLI